MNSESLEQPAEQQGPTKIWNKVFISLFFTSMAFNLGMSMSNSLLSVYVDSLGASASSVGMVMGTFTISSVALRFISAPIMDTYNRKHIVAFAAILVSIAFYGFSMSSDVPTLMAFRLVQGAGMAFGNACCMAMVSEAIPRDKYGSGIGYYSLAQTICQAVGPQVGLTLAAWTNYNIVFIVTGSTMLISVVLAMQIKVDFKRTKKLKMSLNNIIAKESVLPAALMFLLAMGGGVVGSFLIIFSGKQGAESNIGLYFTTTAIVMLVTRPLVGKLVDKYGATKIVIPALFFNGLSLFVISCSKSLLGFLIAAVIAAVGRGAAQPAFMSLSMKSVPSDRRGAASSTNYIGLDLGGLVGPVIAGNIIEAFDYVAMWRVMIVPSVVGMVLMYATRRIIARIEKNFVLNY